MALKFALEQARDTARYRIVKHRHNVTLSSIPETDHFFFCVRDPIERYVSGFLHRQLQGRPRFFIPWSEAEADAFARFQSPEALGVSLSAGGSEQRDAETAMWAIQHVRSSYWDWFKNPEYFESRADHILWIGRQESLDVSALATALGLEKLEMPTDPDQANKTPQAKPELSDLARQNLRQWYASDYFFLDFCHELHFGHDGKSVDPRHNGQTFVGRIMSERPFALHNEDAMRLAKVANRTKPNIRGRIPSRIAVRLHH